MQFSSDFTCSECDADFSLASTLLQHYATHVIDDLKLEYTKQFSNTSKKKQIPNLYPINKKEVFKIDNESDSGVEDVNPLTFCMVTMEDVNDTSKGQTKKYECTHCSKKFGWSTDLKRHILIHTGERPFECDFCHKSFTRNFLLQNHLKTSHDSLKLPNLPSLKPIYSEKVKSKNKTNVIKAQ